MKKVLLMFFVLVVLGSNINAQEENSSGLVWGVRLGMNWATIQSDFDAGLDARTSGVIGVFSRHKLSNSFYIQPELNYILRGAASEVSIQLPANSDAVVVTDYIYSFDHFEIPILVKYNFNSSLSDRFKPEIFLGPFIAFRLSSSLSARDVPDSDRDIDNVKSTDYGIVFGTGMGFKVDNVDILLELRYSLSLSTFDNNVANFDLRNGKFRVFSITTGFVIN